MTISLSIKKKYFTPKIYIILFFVIVKNMAPYTLLHIVYFYNTHDYSTIMYSNSCMF